MLQSASKSTWKAVRFIRFSTAQTAKGLYYGSNEDSKPADMSGSWLDIDYSKRDRDTRREERLGYYSVQDAVNAVSLDATKLKITLDQSGKW